jgi:hypothetical protein
MFQINIPNTLASTTTGNKIKEGCPPNKYSSSAEHGICCYCKQGLRVGELNIHLSLMPTDIAGR